MANDNDDDSVVASIKRGDMKWMNKNPVLGPIYRAVTSAPNANAIGLAPAPGEDHSNFPQD